MKATSSTATIIMATGVILIGLIIIYAFTSSTVIPGLRAAEVIEDASLAYQLASMINTLSTMESGEIIIEFEKQRELIIGEEGSSFFLQIDEIKANFLGSSNSKGKITAKRVKIYKDFEEEGVQIIPA